MVVNRIPIPPSRGKFPFYGYQVKIIRFELCPMAEWLERSTFLLLYKCKVCMWVEVAGSNLAGRRTFGALCFSIWRFYYDDNSQFKQWGGNAFVYFSVIFYLKRLLYWDWSIKFAKYFCFYMKNTTSSFVCFDTWWIIS